MIVQKPVVISITHSKEREESKIASIRGRQQLELTANPIEGRLRVSLGS